METLTREITRKRMLQLGLLGGTALFLPFTRRASAKLYESAIRVTPYEAELRLPGVLESVSRNADTDFYEITMKEAEVEIVPGFKTPIWGYNGEFPGPTIVTREGRRMVVKHTNELPVPTSVHHHGAYVDGDSDGHPLDLIQPGSSKEYVLGNAQIGRTQWYHDHAMHITATNVYRGLAGFHIITDDVEDALSLPRGEYDVPLVIQDRIFGRDGALFYPPDAADDNFGLEGDIAVVNGVAQPRFEVAARKYRLRILNGSNARSYELALGSGKTFTVIASEGGLFKESVRGVSVLPISPAERYEIVVDFSEYAVGEKVVLENRRVERDEPTREIMRFDIVRAEADDSEVPDTLRARELQYDATHLPPDLDNVAKRREFRFDKSNSQFTINGLTFDGNRIDADPREGDTEIWTVYNNSGGWIHPVHVHLVNFKILDRNGKPPEPWERGWKDTVIVGEGQDVRILMRWPKVPVHEEPGDFAYRYVFHCHNLEHEDHDMMAQIGVGENEVVAPEVTAEPEPGTYQADIEVALESSDPDARIFYTTDGSRPLPSSTEYTEPMRIRESLTLRALAVDRIGYRGPLATFSYVIDEENTAATALSLRAGRAALPFGAGTTLSGRLTAAGGAPVSAETVELESRPAGARGFERLRSAETRGDGTFSFAGIQPRKKTFYRVRFDGAGGNYEAAVSPTRRVNVRPVVTNATSTRRVKAGRNRVISGVVRPAHTGTVKVQIRKGKRVVVNRNVRLVNSRYRLVYRPKAPGLYTVRTTMPGHADHLAGMSPIKRFRVMR